MSSTTPPLAAQTLDTAATHRRAEFRRNLEGWLFASPWIVGFVLFTLGPMLVSFVLAFTDWDLLSSPTWVGARNIQELMRDDLLIQSLKVTTIYAITSVPLQIIVGLGLAMLLNTEIRG